jgi:hypothetical protein
MTDERREELETCGTAGRRLTATERAWLKREVDRARRKKVGAELADDFLAAALADGPREMNELRRTGRAAGFSSAALLSAKRRLGVAIVRDHARRVHWTLPAFREAKPVQLALQLDLDSREAPPA